jgi:putative NADPH-quinone reductase
VKRILIIQAHPDAENRHLNHVLADAYVAGATEAGHEVRVLAVAELEFPLLRSAQDWKEGVVPAGLEGAQADIKWAEHLVFFFPLWLGGMPALLKGFLEQVARPGFAFKYERDNPFGVKGLKGRSAHLVVTMGMPALVYRWFFFAHSVKALKRNILAFIGISPIDDTVIGLVEKLDPDGVAKLEARMRALGRKGG